MKWPVAVLVGSLMMWTLCVDMPGAQETGSGPKMVVEETEFRFDEVMEGVTVEHAFRVLNRGDQPLQILDVKPG